MAVHYLQLPAGSEPPDISAYASFRAVVIIEEKTSPEWQAKTSSWLVLSGCLYMMAWGENCSSWDDSVDYANLEQFDFGEIPEDKDTMTTWHENETLKEVFWFAKNCAIHPLIELKNTILIHVSGDNCEKEFLAEYNLV